MQPPRWQPVSQRSLCRALVQAARAKAAEEGEAAAEALKVAATEAAAAAATKVGRRTRGLSSVGALRNIIRRPLVLR